MLQSIIGVLFGNNNRIKIQLDKSIYYTGEQVSGTVLFEINEAFEYNTIMMKLKGSENVNLDNNEINNSSSGQTDGVCHYTLSVPILEERYSLISKNSSSGLLHRGHYLLPFRIALPAGALSSFHYNADGLHGRILYSLEVEVQVSGILKRNLKSQDCEVLIRQFNRDSVMPLQIVDEMLAQPFWCTPGAIVELAVAMDRNIYSPGDKLAFKFALSSPFNRIKYVEVTFVRIIRIGSPDRCRRRETLLGRVNTGRVSGCIERRTSFTIPESEAFSVQGKLIECKYELRFRLRADWCYSSLLRLEIKVHDSCLPSYEALTS